MVDCRALVGQEWDYGKQDCYTLVRQYYEQFGVQLRDFERPEDLGTTDSIFLKHAERLGFQQVEFEQRQKNDVLIMRLGTRTPMHAAIYVGGDRILHQRMNSISAVEPLRQYYWKRTVAVFRHATCLAGR
ncbi:Cell wall-associated hydrolases (invasion-associated proteins) (Spr) [uncultured Mediterranean phage uvMED]|nr:Cell wall-associated hydrolases (invasion-associated proteins) (Spr) [uncultured Mediterranean phage uvMED]BAR24980.1 Cell wall-associated hydrolases (invasion-associated proteins) (Spr) [uncultured Mediterranean phage uvMED]BAR25138.1 Cell wall-associated hydrolases (invasion-associated proteins) (Spr) [uncultured Mediterranean phage uvMED]